MLKGVAALASESTNNALAYIKEAERSLTERLAYNISLRIQDAVEQGTLKGYIKALGSNSMKFFEASKDITLHDYGIFIQDKPDEYEKEKMSRRLEQALQSSQITIADSLAIENIDNIKQAEEVLAFRIKRNQEEAIKKAERQQQMNAQVQMQSAQAAEQAKQQTLQVDAQVKAQLIQMEKELDYKLQEQKYQYEMQIEQLRVTGRIEQRKIEGQSREYIADVKTSKEKGINLQEGMTS